MFSVLIFVWFSICRLLSSLLDCHFLALVRFLCICWSFLLLTFSHQIHELLSAERWTFLHLNLKDFLMLQKMKWRKVIEITESLCLLSSLSLRNRELIGQSLQNLKPNLGRDLSPKIASISFRMISIAMQSSIYMRGR